MIKVKLYFKKNRKVRFRLLLLVLIILIFSLPFLNQITFWGKIYPGIKVNNIDVEGLKVEEATVILSDKIIPLEKIILTDNEQEFEISLRNLDFSYNFAGSAQAAYEIYRTGNPISDFNHQFKARFDGINLGLRFNLNSRKLDENLSVIAGQVSQDPVFPSVKLTTTGVAVENGKAGKEVDLKALKIKIEEALAYVKEPPIEIPIKIVDPSLTQNQAQEFKARAGKFTGKKLNLTFEDNTFTFAEKELFSLFNPNGGYYEETVDGLIENILNNLNRQPQNAVFIFLEGQVQEFSPAKDGVIVNTDLLKQQITEALSALEVSNEKITTITIPVDITPPKITTGDVNNLGIKEIIGRGTSHFKGSISSRIHNIILASSKFNSILIAPGETLSFNKTLGDISIYTGYQQAYIIKDGKTVLGDGGGVCQVSTTLFRAALDAGLPILERRAHSYRVSYYEQGSPPGIDATVFDPTTDLKIKNDTENHILIQTKVDKKTSTLSFELYGTADGRVSTTTKPVVKNPIPPPEDLYQDDPALPSGTIKQIDWKAWGANVFFTYKVQKGDEAIYEKTFYSNYRPWQAVFLRGTGPTN